MLFEHHLQVSVDALGTHAYEPEKDHARQYGSRGGHQVSEVQIMCEYDGAFAEGLSKDFRIRQPVETFFEKMNCLVAFGL